MKRASFDFTPNPDLGAFPAETPDGFAGDATGAPPPTGLSFKALLDEWAKDVPTAPKTQGKWRAAFASLAETAGHDDATKLTREDVRRWKEARREQGRSAKTIADAVTGLRGIYAWGERNGLVPAPNPMDHMAPKVPRRAEDSREGYTDAEAATILLAARQEQGFQRWMPWLLAFTGARIGELADLSRADVRQESGTWIFDIRPKPINALKEPGAQRMVPIHPALIEEGLLDYLATVPAKGPLWPDVTANAEGSRAINAAAAHGRWLRGKVGITDKRRGPAHSWRHRMKDALRRHRVPEQTQDALLGHANPANAGAGYGKGLRGMPDVTAEDLAKVPLPPGVTIP